MSTKIGMNTNVKTFWHTKHTFFYIPHVKKINILFMRNKQRKKIYIFSLYAYYAKKKVCLYVFLSNTAWLTHFKNLQTDIHFKNNIPKTMYLRYGN